MFAIEFNAIQENGVIKIPEKYLKDISGHLKVIILMENSGEKFIDKNPFNAIMKPE